MLVGIPELNRERTLPRLFEAMLNLDYPKSELRILFVDGGSTDKSRKAIFDFAEVHRKEFRDIVLAGGPSWNLSKSRNYCIQTLEPNEYLWFVDSDVYPTPDSLNVLFEMMKDYDIACLYYTHDQTEQPPYDTVGKPIWSVPMGCTLLSPVAVRATGLFNERWGNLAPEDAAYCIIAFNKGMRIGYDSNHPQFHDDKERFEKWYYPIEETITRRKHRGWWLPSKIRTRRYIGYFVLFGCLLLMYLNLLFGLVIVAYFSIQVFRKRNVAHAFGTTINALIVPPVSIFGYVELRMKGGAYGAKVKGQ